MIFEKGKRTHYDFFIYNSVLELVESFKYLGITLFKNGNWYRSEKKISLIMHHSDCTTFFAIF